jgi:tyrosyl-tRNA synthetase
MLIGLHGSKQPEGYDENESMDIAIASKMSKSKPESSIFVHDSKEEIARKINSAYCPPRVLVANAPIEYSKYIVFRKKGSLKIERPEKYGGTVEFDSFAALERAYSQGTLHPADLKRGVAEALDEIISPIRLHFERDPSARRLYSAVKTAEATAEK